MYRFLNFKVYSFITVISAICITLLFLSGYGLRVLSLNKHESFIKYAEFNVCLEALEKSMNIDISSQSSETKYNWIEILSLLGSKYGGDFRKYKDSDIDKICDEYKIKNNYEEMATNKKLYNYYKNVYSAVLCEFVGEYKTEESLNENEKESKTKYGLKAFSPIAKTFPYSHFDDFGISRSYGFKRKHLGHDMMAAVGTPVISVESGIVEVVGWNQYGGWRIGIRSFDRKRYYYYAHLRKDRPFHCDIKEGKVVKAGDVIGYVGRTGYSTKENTNNINTSHLHFGLQLIFDESQKECDNEIWIDLYSITRLLEKNKSETRRDSATKEYYRKKEFTEKSLNCS